MSNKSARWFSIFYLCVQAGVCVGAPLATNGPVWILDPTFKLNQLPLLESQSTFPWGYVRDPVNSLALQSDGKIIVAGGFLSETGAYRGFARLLPNGGVDPDFRPGRAAAMVHAVAVTPQQNIYAVTRADDLTLSIAQYDALGQSRWSHSIYPGAYPQSLLALPDGSALVGGFFTNVGGTQREYLARINESGQLQSQFAPALNGRVTVLAQQQDGKILVGGAFTSVNGAPRARLARLTSDGQLDESFNPGDLITVEPNAVAVMPNGKIIVSGNFLRRNGSARDRLLRLSPDGSLDDSFTAELDQPANQIVGDSQNRIVLGGLFTQVSSSPRSRIARLLSDGTLDAAFDPGAGPNSAIQTLVIDAQGNYLIGGHFQKIGRSSVNGFARVVPVTSTIAVDFAEEQFLAGEQYREAVVKLMRYGPAEGDLVVDVWTAPGTDPELTEFKPFSAEVRFAAGDLEKTIIIPFPDDGEVEFDEFIPIHCQIRGENYVHTSQIHIIEDERPVVSTGMIAVRPGDDINVPAANRRAVANSRVAFGGIVYSEAGVYGPSFYGVGVVNLDGTPSTFKPARVERYEFAEVQKLIWTSDDKLVVSGAFTSINGIHKTNVVRFNLDGSIDSNFNPPASASIVAALPDGKLLAAAWDGENTISPYSLVRLNADGSIDSTWPATQLRSWVEQCIPLADGKVLLNVGAYGIRRLLPDGAEDPSFSPPKAFQFNPNVYYGPQGRELFALPDGKILVRGGFNQVDGFPRPGLARLNVDGSLDLSFRPALDSNAVFPLADGRILSGSYGRPWQLLNADGSRAFDLIIPDLSANGYSTAPLTQLADGRMIDPNLRIIPLANRKLTSVTFDPGQTAALAEGAVPREIKVTRTGDTSQTLTVPFHAQLIKGDAGDDLTITPATLTFAPMQTKGAVQVQALTDNWIESDEKYKITAGDSSDLYVPNAIDLVIQDRDGRPGSAGILFDLSATDPPRLATLADGSLLMAGWTDAPLIIYNPQTETTNTLPPIFPEERRRIFALAPIPDGFLVAGDFLGPTNATTNVVFRFRSDGSRDTNFKSPPLPLYPLQIIPEPSGTFLVIGFGDQTVVRFNADGSINRKYVTPYYPRQGFLSATNRLIYTFDYGVACLDLAGGYTASGFSRVELSGGGIFGLAVGEKHFYLNGWFRGVNGTPRAYLARFTFDGRFDSTYQPVLNGDLWAMTLDRQNRLVIFGNFTSVNGVGRPGGARLNFDGSLDRTFEPDVELSIPQGALVSSTDYLTALPNGDLFALVYISGRPNPYSAAIISSDLPLRANLADNNGAFELRLTTLPRKTYLIETSSNLRDWQPLLSTNVAGYQLKVAVPAGLPNLFVRAKSSQ
ncbi:MAG TPA: Calx-beta domain-containing protein [Verrucomicrobiae bacterium]|nr:Calx-beta domain-containing protein [Verrucomicrobiae bacterium]